MNVTVVISLGPYLQCSHKRLWPLTSDMQWSIAVFQIWDQIFKTVFPKWFFLFYTINSKRPRNIYNLRHKERNGHFYPMKVQISSISKVFFQLKFLFNFRLSKTYGFNPSLKNMLGLYDFKSLRQVTKIYFEKFEFNPEIFTWSLLAVLP